MSTLLLDIGALSECCTDHALDALYKARAEGLGDEGIWTPHENPWIRDQVDEVTRWGLSRSRLLHEDLKKTLDALPVPLFKADVPWLRWSEKEFQGARRQLEGKPPGNYALSDWLLLVDYLIQRYFPPAYVLSQVDYLTVRSVIAGKLQANLEARALSDSEVLRVAGRIPAQIGKLPDLSARLKSLIAFAKARLAEAVTAVTESLRHRLKGILITHAEAIAMGDKAGTTHRSAEALLDAFGELNHDWRRIAITETGRALNEGYVASLPPATRLKRMEAYATACPFCRKIDGTVVTVVPADAPNKDWDTEIWLGKTNIGRSASPRKRMGNQLVLRAPDELWTITPGLIHPNCRGGWVRVSEKPPEVSEAFNTWMEGLLEAAA